MRSQFKTSPNLNIRVWTTSEIEQLKIYSVAQSSVSVSQGPSQGNQVDLLVPRSNEARPAGMASQLIFLFRTIGWGQTISRSSSISFFFRYQIFDRRKGPLREALHTQSLRPTLGWVLRYLGNAVKDGCVVYRWTMGNKPPHDHWLVIFLIRAHDSLTL